MSRRWPPARSFASVNPSKLAEDDHDGIAGWAQSFQLEDIRSDDLEVVRSRSSGPGGQNVNKVNTKVTMKFSIRKVDWLPQFTKTNLLEKGGMRITKDGQFMVYSQAYRTQTQNHDACLRLIYEAVMEASKVPAKPDEESMKRIAQMKLRTNEARLREKKQKSQHKQSRRWKDE